MVLGVLSQRTGRLGNDSGSKRAEKNKDELQLLQRRATATSNPRQRVGHPALSVRLQTVLLGLLALLRACQFSEHGLRFVAYKKF
jgi:hypothetical protein